MAAVGRGVATRSIHQALGEVGHGGRSSVSGLRVALFGATGFLGRYVANELGQVGSTVSLANRGCEMETRHLRPMFDLGNLALYFYSARDDDSIREVIADSDVVINMIGKHYETKHLAPVDKNGKLNLLRGSNINYPFEEVNMAIPAKLAKISKEMGVEKFVHVSALAADILSPSEQYRTKFLGEQAVRAEFPEAIIVKPATLFGHEDRFLNWQGEIGMRPFPGVPMLEDGRGLVQPVYVGDVAKAIVKMLEDGGSGAFQGATLELAGPAEFTRKEIMEFVTDITISGKPPIPLPEKILSLLATAASILPEPYLTPDEVKRWGVDEVLDPNTDAITLQQLGIDPMPIEKVAFQYLHRFRKGGHFVYTEGYHENEGRNVNDPSSPIRSVAGNRPFV